MVSWYDVMSCNFKSERTEASQMDNTQTSVSFFFVVCVWGGGGGVDGFKALQF